MGTDYTNLDRPYDNLLQREGSDIAEVSKASQPAQNGSDPVAGGSSGGTSGSVAASGSGTSTQANGSVETQPVKSDGGMGDVWIKNFIKSTNWKPKTVGFYLDGLTGYAEFTDVFVSGEIEALTGEIGGWTINETNISSTGIVLDSIGSLRSIPFVSGPLGTGWSINDDGTAELQNVTVRGIIRTSVFEKDTISAVNGMVLISKADALDSDMTALDASTLTITGESSFVANEVIRIKDGTNDEWMLVTSAASAPTYTVTRDLAASYAANTNPIWTKGTAVVSMGVGAGTKTGFVLLDSSSTNSPYIDIYKRTGTDWYSYGTGSAPSTPGLPNVRLGWLKGITDSNVGLSATDVWGLYSDSVYLTGTINATSGKFGTSTNYWSVGATGLTAVSPSTDVFINYGKTDFGQDSTNGFILGYDFSASKPKFEIGSSATKLMTYDGTDFTLTGGIITGGTIQTASSGSRFVTTAATQRFETINANGDIVGTMNWSSTTAAVFKLSPIYDARRALEIVIPASFAGAGTEGDAKGITINNAADSLSIDITDGGLVGLQIGPCDTSAIVIANAPANGPTINITHSGGDYPIIDMTQSGTASNSYGIRITSGTGAVMEGVFVDHNANSHVTGGIMIDRDGNTSFGIVPALIIECANADASATAVGIQFNSAAIDAIIQVAADTTAAGAYKGRIPIYVATTKKYLHYYDA